MHGDWIVISTSAIQRDGAVETIMTEIEFHNRTQVGGSCGVNLGMAKQLLGQWTVESIFAYIQN